MENEKTNGLLKGYRILDFTRVLSGPFCTRMLCDLGAEVIKIESGGGDSMRKYPPFKGGFSSNFTQWNSGKKSIGINLRNPKGLELAKHLVAVSDVVTENFRPGVFSKMGLGYPVLKEINPRIILCSISGFGQNGCEVKRLAYTDNIQAYSGMDYMLGKMMGKDVDPPGYPYSFADSYASLNAAVAILAALLSRNVTGEGQAIDISMLDSMLAANDSTLQKFIFTDGQDDNPGPAFRPPLKMKDGHMAAALSMEFERVLQAIGRVDLLEERRFKVVAERQKPENFSEYYQMVKDWAKKTTMEEAIRLFERYDIPYAKVHSVADIVNSQVVRERNMLVDVDFNHNSVVKVVNTPFKFSNTPTGPQSRPPHWGEHNKEVLGGLLKLSDNEIEAMTQEGILVQQEKEV
jgi:CoA:oxalate CoA-transferase